MVNDCSGDGGRRVISIVLADDHSMVRSGLEGLLATQHDFSVLGGAATGQEAVDLVTTLKPDVLLCDLRMPILDGVAAIREIKRRGLATNVLVLTTYDTDADILRAIEAGATGYLLKEAASSELFRAVRATAIGESVLSPAVTSRLVGRARGTAPSPMLSSREIEVLDMVAKGAGNKHIARDLRISEATVKTHLMHIFEKLSVDGRTSAVTIALERGIIRLTR
ncbi:MAG: response regulator transcription factor [Gemmatimonadaceae bacterium]|nr:response regulator transcription factor [Gemmatimonadaceae bacterium]